MADQADRCGIIVAKKFREFTAPVSRRKQVATNYILFRDLPSKRERLGRLLCSDQRAHEEPIDSEASFGKCACNSSRLLASDFRKWPVEIVARASFNGVGMPKDEDVHL